jgi:hypothetical protein
LAWHRAFRSDATALIAAFVRLAWARGLLRKNALQTRSHAMIKIAFFAAAAAMSLASSAFAQNPKSSNNPNDPAKQDPLTMQGSAPETWSMLKGHEKGYLSKEDAQPNSWLAQNFKSCDKDNDGKVTESEYTRCEKMKSQGIK